MLAKPFVQAYRALTLDLFCDPHELIPRHSVANDIALPVPFWELQTGCDEFGNVAGVCECHRHIARARNCSHVVLNVDGDDVGQLIRLYARVAPKVEKVSDVEERVLKCAYLELFQGLKLGSANLKVPKLAVSRD